MIHITSVVLERRMAKKKREKRTRKSSSNMSPNKSQDGTKMVTNGPQIAPMAQHGRKTAPRWPQGGPKGGPRWPQDGLKMAQDGSKIAEGGPKLAPR